MIGLLGKKVGMTQLFDEDGRRQPVTVLEVGPCYVTALRSKKTEGYSAIQIGFDEVKEKSRTKPQLGQFKKAKVKPVRFIREIRTDNIEGVEVGTKLLVDNFEVGDMLDVEGVSIGHGYQGVVKRHHFKGGEKAHGSKMGRESGSIGQGNTDPGRVPKGRKMAGQMGNKRITIQNIKVVKVDQPNNLLVVAGSVPGVEGSYLVIKGALKKAINRKWKVGEGEAKKEKKAGKDASKEVSSQESSSESPKESPKEVSAEKNQPKTE